MDEYYFNIHKACKQYYETFGWNINIINNDIHMHDDKIIYLCEPISGLLTTISVSSSILNDMSVFVRRQETEFHRDLALCIGKVFSSISHNASEFYRLIYTRFGDFSRFVGEIGLLYLLSTDSYYSVNSIDNVHHIITGYQDISINNYRIRAAGFNYEGIASNTHLAHVIAQIIIKDIKDFPERFDGEDLHLKVNRIPLTL